MIDDRSRVPVEPEYVAAVGLATYAFARLEWDAIWCFEKIDPQAMVRLSGETAGTIARQFVAEVKKMVASPDQRLLLAAAEDFRKLVQTRNGIMHGKPATDTDGGQRLFRDGVAWTVESLNAAADEFTECSIRLNDLLYGFLK